MIIFNKIIESILSIALSSGIFSLPFENYIMLIISCALLYLAIVKKFEPLLLLPIAFGMFLVNLYPPIMAMPETVLKPVSKYIIENGFPGNYPVVEILGQQFYQIQKNGGLLYYLYQGVKLGIYPPLIFLGIGAMTDFSPLIANPKSLLMGAAAQLGIFITFIGALLLGFTPNESGAISIFCLV